MKKQSLPLFPLSAHLMPGGRMTLRIFEPRYVRLVKESCAKGHGFVICMLDASGDKDKNTHIFSVGTFVTIIDFDSLPDGMFSVTVEGKHAVSISDIQTEPDGLRIGSCETKKPWCCDIEEADIQPMRHQLEEIFLRYDDLNKLYKVPSFEDPIWVIHRWLELIPVDPAKKQHFLSQQDCQPILSFLKQLVIE